VCLGECGVLILISKLAKLEKGLLCYHIEVAYLEKDLDLLLPSFFSKRSYTENREYEEDN